MVHWVGASGHCDRGWHAVFARGTKLVNLGTGDGGAEQIFVDGVLLVMVGHVKAAGLEIVHLVRAEGFGFDWMSRIGASTGKSQTERRDWSKRLVIAHGGVPVGDRGG